MTADDAPLARLRRRIDAVDRRIVLALAERQRLIESVAQQKGEPGAVHDPARVRQVMARVHAAARVCGLSPAIAEPVWRTLIDRCIAHELAAWDRTRG